MNGGPSQVDTFDPAAAHASDDANHCPASRVQFADTGNLLKSPWKFNQHGQSGLWVSELFPRVAEHDDLCMIHSVHGTNPAYGALLKLHTGSDNPVRPSIMLVGQRRAGN